jgi:copper homeostasis protein
MRKIETEVCCYSIESCLAAAEKGATRVELCASPYEGGTTPSAATIKMVRAIESLELAVMIRPRGGDFLYSDIEFEQMQADIRFARECGADAVVLGVLNPNGTVDVQSTAAFVASASPMEVVFHRAIDTTPDIFAALEDIIVAGCTRVLTSGGRNTAPEALDVLHRMVEQAAGRIEIMAGSGVNPSNAASLIATGVNALHFSARAVRPSGMTWHSPVPMCAAGLPEFEIAYSDPEFIAKMVRVC